MEEQSDGNRFCQDCKKVVVDMSEMTESEAVSFLQANPGSCVNFIAGQVEEIRKSELPANPVKRSLRYIPLRKAAAAAATLALLHGQLPAKTSSPAPIGIEVSSDEGGPGSRKKKSGPSTNTLLTGIAINQRGRMVKAPIILKVYLGSELIAYPVEVLDGLFFVDLKGKASASDKITIVMPAQTVQRITFAKTKTRILLGDAQNLTFNAKILSEPPPRRGGGSRYIQDL